MIITGTGTGILEAYRAKVEQMQQCTERKKEIKTEKRERDHKEGTGFSDLFHAAVDAIVEEQGW